MTWRIYYADGSTFDGSEALALAPKYGVAAVLHGAIVEHGFDWYVLERGGWVGVKGDASLILKFLYRAGDIQAVFAGESVPNELFAPALARAVADQARRR